MLVSPNRDRLSERQEGEALSYSYNSSRRHLYIYMSPARARAVLAGAALSAALPLAAQAPPAQPHGAVYAAQVESIIHPVSAEYMIDTLERADREGGAL